MNESGKPSKMKDRWTDTNGHTQTNYNIPHCAGAQARVTRIYSAWSGAEQKGLYLWIYIYTSGKIISMK